MGYITARTCPEAWNFYPFKVKHAMKHISKGSKDMQSIKKLQKLNNEIK